MALVWINVAAFLAEVLFSSFDDSETLYRLGALWTPAVVRGGEWWRLVTALFLHANPIHLVFNMLALLVFGSWAEQTFGRLRYGLVYAVSGIGSMAALVALMQLRWVGSELVVGASGAIMGLVGAFAAAFLLRLPQDHTALAARRFATIAAVLLLQFAIDLTIPQVTLAGHLRG